MRILPACVLAAAVALVGGCSEDVEAGRMDAKDYRSLRAKGSDLTVDDVKDQGGIRSRELRQAYLDEGGKPPKAGEECWYAVTHHRRTAGETYRGTARFCFDREGRFVSAERHRADLAR